MAEEESGDKGTPACTDDHSKGEGLRALRKGMLPCLIQIPPGQDIVWMVRDQVMLMLDQIIDERAGTFFSHFLFKRLVQ